jgi:hypothetical protein
MVDDTLHLGPDELDLWLDGRLPELRTSHLETCEQCRATAEEVREIVAQLARLPRAVPSPAFADRVMARVTVAPEAEHLLGEELDLWVTGQLPAARRAHLVGCPQCQAVADAERVLVMRLEALPLFDPKPGFANRVMDRVELPVTSLSGAWRVWRGSFVRDPRTVGIAASAAMLLGGSIAASAAWAAANQDVITGAGTWLISQGQQWFWQGVALGTGFLEQQSWYASARTALTPGRIAALTGCVAMLYAGGVLLLRRLLSLPGSEAARALS